MLNTINQLLLGTNTGLIFVQNDLSLVSLNNLASKIISRKDGITDLAGKLFLTDRSAYKCLKYEVGASQNNVRKEALVCAMRANNEPPYRLKVLPFDDEWHQTNQKRPHSIVLVMEPNKRFTFPHWVFEHYYGLTGAELKLAESVFYDSSLQDYADQRGIKISTVRWTLDNIFSKTYAHSQKELKSLALKFVD